jgi:hypothetical protein
MPNTFDKSEDSFPKKEPSGQTVENSANAILPPPPPSRAPRFGIKRPPAAAALVAAPADSKKENAPPVGISAVVQSKTPATPPVHAPVPMPTTPVPAHTQVFSTRPAAVAPSARTEPAARPLPQRPATAFPSASASAAPVSAPISAPTPAKFQPAAAPAAAAPRPQHTPRQNAGYQRYPVSNSPLSRQPQIIYIEEDGRGGGGGGAKVFFFFSLILLLIIGFLIRFEPEVLEKLLSRIERRETVILRRGPPQAPPKTIPVAPPVSTPAPPPAIPTPVPPEPVPAPPAPEPETTPNI